MDNVQYVSKTAYICQLLDERGLLRPASFHNGDTSTFTANDELLVIKEKIFDVHSVELPAGRFDARIAVHPELAEAREEYVSRKRELFRHLSDREQHVVARMIRGMCYVTGSLLILSPVTPGVGFPLLAQGHSIGRRVHATLYERKQQNILERMYALQEQYETNISWSEK